MILRKLRRNLILTLPFVPLVVVRLPLPFPFHSLTLSLCLSDSLYCIVPANRDNIIMPDNNIILSAGILQRLEVN